MGMPTVYTIITSDIDYDINIIKLSNILFAMGIACLRMAQRYAQNQNTPPEC